MATVVCIRRFVWTFRSVFQSLFLQHLVGSPILEDWSYCVVWTVPIHLAPLLLVCGRVLGRLIIASLLLVSLYVTVTDEYAWVIWAILIIFIHGLGLYCVDSEWTTLINAGWRSLHFAPIFLSIWVWWKVNNLWCTQVEDINLEARRVIHVEACQALNQTEKFLSTYHKNDERGRNLSDLRNRVLFSRSRFAETAINEQELIIRLQFGLSVIFWFDNCKDQRWAWGATKMRQISRAGRVSHKKGEFGAFTCHKRCSKPMQAQPYIPWSAPSAV